MGAVQQVNKFLASYDEEEFASGWLLHSTRRAYRGRHVEPNTLVQLVAHEVARRGIPLTCHRVQLVGAAEAVQQRTPLRDPSVPHRSSHQ